MNQSINGEVERLPAERAQAEQTQSLMDGIPESCAVVVTTAMLVVALLWSSARGPALGVWLVSVCGIQAIRFGLYRAYKQHPDIKKPIAWAESITLNSVWSGSLWGGGGGLIFATTASALEQAFIAILLMGLGAGAITVTVAYLRANRAFVIPATTPVIVACAWQALQHADTERGIYALMAVLLAIYLLFITRLGKQLNKRLIDSFYKRSKLEELNRKLEEQRFALQDARQAAVDANHFKTFLMKFASHDIKNYLLQLDTTITRAEFGALNPEANSMFQAQLRSVSNFTNDIQNIADIMEEALIAKVVAVDLPVLLAKVRNDLLALAHFQSIQLTLVPETVWVETDPMMLERIVYNVTLNAIQNTSQGGIVTIRVRLVPHTAEVHAVSVEVQDTGRGMSASQIPDLQAKGVMLSRKLAHRGDREHLGLQIVAGFTQVLGHPALIRSEVGRGTCFQMTLTETAPPESRPEAMTAEAFRASPKGLFIAVVEDDHVYLKEVSRQLMSMGCLIEASLSGEDAAHALQQHDRVPDALLCDYRLGRGATGLDAASAICAALGKTIPLIVMSAEDSESIKREVLNAGAVFFSKPLDLDRLRAFLGGILPV